jgi:MFS transporter, DHA1 family, multidrug resistance protein
MWLLLGLASTLLGIGLIAEDRPWLITIVMSLYVMPFILPVNILYPLSLEILPDSKGRAAAMINFGRLAFSAAGVELVSYVYTGHFAPIAIFIFVLTLLAFIVPINNWRGSKEYV